MNKKIAEEIDNLELKNYKYWSSFYAKEAERSQAFLKIFGFSKNDLLLSDNCTKSLNTLVNIAQQLKLDQINEKNFSTSLRELILKKFDLESQVNIKTNETNELNEKMIQLSLFRETLLKDKKLFESEITSEKENLQQMEMNIQFMQAKMEKYRSELDEMKLHNDNIDKDLYHDKIVADYQNLTTIQKQLQESKTKLESYQDLPPNMNLAQLKIQALSKEIELMEHEIEKYMFFVN